MTQSTPKEILRAVIKKSLQEMDPYHVLSRQLNFDSQNRTLTVMGESLALENGQEIWVLGSGKASAAMAQALEAILGEVIRDGLVITPKGTRRELEKIQLLEGAHPIPDKNSLAATYELIQLAEKIPENDLVLYVLSGGSSALLCLPAGNLELEEVTATHRLLLNAGADIHEMNVIRTVLSKIKGGQLLKALSHTRLVDLIISDVPGDDFRTIGSGPTTPGVLDYERAFRILKQHELWNQIPHEVRAYIARRMHEPKTLQIEPFIKEHRQYLVSSAAMLAETAAGHCRQYGYEPEIVHPAYNLPVRDLESTILGKINLKQPKGKSTTTKPGKPQNRALILYGESSVHVTGPGKGGRNQEIALRIARHLEPGSGVTFASVGSDGIDGPTDAAGAIVDGDTVRSAESKGIDPDSYLTNNDSWNFFDRAGGHLKTGPTGNNLMDLQIVFIGKPMS